MKHYIIRSIELITPLHATQFVFTLLAVPSCYHGQGVHQLVNVCVVC